MRTRPLLVASFLWAAGCGDNLSHPPDHEPLGAGGSGGALPCLPNLDGRIDANELRAAFDVPVSYLVSPPGETREVNVAGKAGEEGDLVWDFSQDFAADRLVRFEASKSNSHWYAASFPGGEFAAPLDVTQSLDGIYRSDETGIELLGVASVEEKPPQGQTLLVYDTPITVYRFPLSPGTSWTSVGEIKKGTIRGLPYAGKDVYEVTDDALGRLELHDYIFTEVHRVRTTVTLSPAVGASQVQRQVGFVFECFGEVTRATSKTGEENDNFTTAAEVRRLGQ